MKHFLYLILLLAAFGFQSCLKDDENLFDKNPTERMSATLVAYQATLLDSKEGWALEYYPNKDLSYGGFTYTVKFDADNATVGMDYMGSDKMVTSMYKLTNDNGPVLTFDTYNPVMHFFAKPSQSQPDGKGGDYEFIFMAKSEKADTIFFKGKKTGNRMIMVKLKEPAAAFLDKISAQRDILEDIARKILFFKNAQMDLGGVNLKIGGVDIPTVFTRSSITFTDVKSNKLINMAFIPTTTGLKLLNPVTVNGVTFQFFDFNADNSVLECRTSKSTTLTLVYPRNPTPSETLVYTSEFWNVNLFDKTARPDAFFTLFASAYNSSKSIFGIVPFKSFGFGSSPTDGSSAFAVRTEGIDFTHGYVMSPVDGTTDQVKMQLTVPDELWGTYLPAFTAVAKYITRNSPYTVTVDDSWDPTTVTLVSVAQPTVKFKLGL